MAKTWDTSRTGGGTYEFTQDAQGNYTLGSVGFDKISKLNLPELKAEATTTAADTKKTTATASAQTAKAFGNVQPFYYDQKGEGGTGTQYTMKKEGDLSTETQPMTTGDGPWTMRSGVAKKPEMLGDTGGSIKRGDTGWENVAKSYTLADKKTPERFPGESDIYKTMDSDTASLLPGQSVKRADRFGSGQWGPKPSAGMPTTRIPDRITSPLRPAIKKPKPTEVVTTQLKKVNTALSPLAKAVGFVMNPVKGLIGAAAGMVKDTPTQSHARKYFNTREDNTNRIAGNPATDLYAGMNQTSAFGNLEKSGKKRIDTRTKTATKMQGKWSKERMDKFTATTEKMKGQQKDYSQSKAAAKNKADLSTGGVAPGASGGGGNGGGNTRVICNELHRTHELSTKDWVRDIHFTFNTLTEKHVKGYLVWAVPTVKYMKKYPTYRKIWKHLAQHRANDIAWRLNEGKFDLLGRIYAGIGEPLCWLIGNFTGNKQINELNITNWRKA